MLGYLHEGFKIPEESHEALSGVGQARRRNPSRQSYPCPPQRNSDFSCESQREETRGGQMNTTSAILLVGGAVLLLIGFYLPGITIPSLMAIVFGGLFIGMAIWQI